MQEAKKAIHVFHGAYRTAWNEFKGFGSAIFPAGCFKVRTRFHMPCSEPCFDWCSMNPGLTQPRQRRECPLYRMALHSCAFDPVFANFAQHPAQNFNLPLEAAPKRAH